MKIASIILLKTKENELQHGIDGFIKRFKLLHFDLCTLFASAVAATVLVSLVPDHIIAK